MDLKVVANFSKEHHNKSVSQLKELGMNSDRRFVKVRTMLKDIIKRTDEYERRNKINARDEEQIGQYLKLLKEYGIVIKEEEPEKKNVNNRSVS